MPATVGLLGAEWEPDTAAELPGPERAAPAAARAPGLLTSSAVGPAMSSTRPARSRASTTHDIPVESGWLNDTATECAVAPADADAEGEGEGDFDEDAEGDDDPEPDPDPDLDPDPDVFFGLPVWLSTSSAALSVCWRSDCGNGR